MCNYQGVVLRLRPIYLIPILILLVGFMQSFLKTRQHLLENAHYADQINNLRIAFNETDGSYHQTAQFILQDIVNRPEVLALFSQADGATIAEQARIRDELYALLEVTYAHLTAIDFRKLHFHLPDNTSFLRFHQPDHFGDDLSDIRETVVIANQDLVPTSGFEIGRHAGGFRYVYPLFYENQHIGSVEISVSSLASHGDMNRLLPGSTIFIVAKDVFEAHVFDSERTQYEVSPLSDAFYYDEWGLTHDDDNDKIPWSTIAAINNNLGDSVTDRLVAGENFATTVTQDGMGYTMAFQPVYNLDDTLVGYFVSYRIDDFIPNSRSGFFITQAIIGSTGLLLIVFVVFVERNVNLVRRQRDALKLANLATQQSENRFQQIFEQSSAVKLLFDAETGRIADANPAALVFYGYSHEQLCNMRIHDLDVMTEAEVNASLFRQRTDNRQQAYGEFCHQIADGSTRNVAVFIGPVVIEGKNYFNAIIMDITSMHVANQHRDMLLQQLVILNQTAVTLFTLDNEAKIYDYLGQQLAILIPDAVIIINENLPDRNAMQIRGVYGLEDSLISKTLEILKFSPIGQELRMHPLAADYFMRGELVRYPDGLVSLAEGYFPRPIVKQLVRMVNISDVFLIGVSEGEELYAGVQIYLRGETTIESPEVIETLIYQASMVLREKRAQQAVRESEARYRSIITSAAEGILLFDRSGVILTCNPSAEAILGENLSDFAGVSMQDLPWRGIHEDGSALTTADNPAAICLRTGQSLSNQIMGYYRQNGELVWLSINAEPIFHEGEDSPYAVISSFTDITEQRAAQEQKLALAVERHRVELITHFIRDVSHEFRTPLSIISTSAYFLSRLDDQDRRKEQVHKIENQITNISHLINMLMLMARLDSGVVMKRQPLEIANLIDKVVVKQSRASQAKNLDLMVDIQDADQITVEGDPEYLPIAVENLLDNAVRYTSEGGRVQLRAYYADAAVKIEAKDNGPGIQPEDHEHIFERFWRRDMAHTEPGFGLGLPIARKIIDLHGGRICIQSELGSGTTVTITLPAATTAPAPMRWLTNTP